MKRMTIIAGMLMIVSSVTHVLQLKVYPLEHHVIGAAAFGIIYFFIGLFLLRRNRLAFWLGAILPSIGGVLGVHRFFWLHPNPFTIALRIEVRTFLLLAICYLLLATCYLLLQANNLYVLT